MSGWRGLRVPGRRLPAPKPRAQAPGPAPPAGPSETPGGTWDHAAGAPVPFSQGSGPHAGAGKPRTPPRPFPACLLSTAPSSRGDRTVQRPPMQRGAHRHLGVKATAAACKGLRWPRRAGVWGTGSWAPQGSQAVAGRPGVGPAHRSMTLCPSTRARCRWPQKWTVRDNPFASIFNAIGQKQEGQVLAAAAQTPGITRGHE